MTIIENRYAPAVKVRMKTISAFLRIAVLLLLASGCVMAQVGKPDSVQQRKQIVAERERLQSSLDSLRRQLDSLNAEQTAGSRPDAEIRKDISGTIDAMAGISKRLVELSDDGGGEGGNSGVDAQADDAIQPDSVTSQADTSDWGWAEMNEGEETEAEEQFTLRPNLYKKYPGTFPWLFPRESRLAETVFRYNRVEGFYFGMAQPKRLYWRSKPPVVGTGSLGYGIASHRWRYSIGLFLPVYLEEQIIEFGAEGYSFTDSKDQWMVSRDENTAMALLAREDFMDYFGRDGFTVSGSWYHKTPESMTLRATLAYVHDTYKSLTRNASWSLFGGDKEFRPQPRIHYGNINSFVVTAGLNTEYSFSRSLKGWNILASFEKAGGFAEGDFSFSQAILDVRRYEPVAEYMNINLRARIGASDGELPSQRLFELGGLGTLQGYRFKEFAGTHAALVNAEIILYGSSFTESKGWAASLLEVFNLILFYDGGTVTQPTMMNYVAYRDQLWPRADADFSDGFHLDKWKSDVGVAVGSHDGDFRIGAAWRLDRKESPNFVLRLSRPF
jgi:hypothetical protein